MCPGSHAGARPAAAGNRARHDRILHPRRGPRRLEIRARELKCRSAMMTKVEDIRVAEAVRLIDQHKKTPLSVPDLARAVNVSPSYLTRLFRQQTGRPPAKFARDARLERAHFLLRTSFLTVKEVMAEVGWNDPSHFCRDFKREFGASPTAVRAAARQEKHEFDEL
jgi:transcriptional regulator GlxA family with amidase domain